MSLTTAQKIELNKRTSAVAILTLVTLSHPDEAIADHRMVFNPDDITSNGLVYTSTWFEWTRPNDGAVQPRGQLRAWNGTGELGALVDSVETPLSVKVDLVFSNDLDTVVKSWPNYLWLGVRYDAAFISGDLVQRDYGREMWPPRVMNERDFPGANF